MNKTLGKIGIILLVIGISLIFIEDSTENNLIKTLAEYKRILWIMGGAFIGVGFFGKKKNTTT